MADNVTVQYDGSNTDAKVNDGTAAVETTVSDIVERRNQSRDWMVANYYDELVETYRAIKCRVSPFMKQGPDGKWVEDKSRTNVAMPDLNMMYRRNAARMTAQPYTLRYIGGSDPLMAEALSAHASQQYDRSNEAKHDRRVVMMSEAFGFGYSKLYWDNIAPIRMLRKAIMKGGQIVYNDRRSIMAAQGAPEEEIQGAVQQHGEGMSSDEISQFVGKSGNEIILPTKVKQYEGPVVKSLFCGDMFIEPGVLYLDDSSYVVETYVETDLWLQKMAKLTYRDDSGQQIKAFDPKACQELLDTNPGPEMPDAKISDLRQMFRDVIGKSTPWVQKRLLPGKRFDILECHEQGDDGRMWVTWISEHLRDKPLGRMPYPWELYGKYAYTEFVPLPDLISAIGDSTPRLLRYIHMLLNYTHGQNFDYITNLLKKFLLVAGKEDIPDEAVNRGSWRELRVKDARNITFLQEPPLPSGAFERSAELWRVLGIAEPSLNGVEAGTSMNPQAGKTATTSMLAAKSYDALLQFKIDGRNIYLRELGQKKLWMNQQAATDDWEIEARYWPAELKKMVSQMDPQQLQQIGVNFDPAVMQPEQWVMSSGYGKTAAIRVNPLEIQEDYQVEAEAGSYLAVDDDLRRSAAQDLAQVAMQAPGVLDLRKVVRFTLGTIRGIGDPDSYIIPENPNPQPPPAKVNISLTMPFPQLPEDVQNQILPMLGLQPSQELQHEATINAVGKLSQAADHASNLLSAAEQPDAGQQKPAAAGHSA